MDRPTSSLAALPAVDALLRHPDAAPLIERHGRAAATQAIRDVLAELRSLRSVLDQPAIVSRVAEKLHAQERPTLRPVFNLTGTGLHTNLGRALLPEEAIEAMSAVARSAANLEYDLEEGKRGERDSHVEALVRELTGAEAATIVNNNAAAVLIVLNTLARGKEVPTSRGELIEIGGSFRLPDIMARSGCRLREIGTTNRTHLSDYAEAIGPKTGAVLKVHTSNYAIRGFTASVDEAELATLCASRGVPLVVDMGSGALLDFSNLGIRESTVREIVARGADLVTFSGDKLLGGPQAGIIAGRAALVAKIRKNPLKRALRVDKMTLAALAALLRLYRNPERAAQRIPTLRLLSRPIAEIRAQAERLAPMLQARVEATVEAVACESEVGSGAAPTAKLPSFGLAIRPGTAKLAAAFRALPVPVIGRLQEGAFVLDLRTLEDEVVFVSQLEKL
ncbi:MAG TPA: L-seryl-tRNA(Sec) selenium transferase [Burkholderiales bacterium]|nr:L-seryl-tRNA(Sec) selenium transferase [Burkholderiales bacterium]